MNSSDRLPICKTTAERARIPVSKFYDHMNSSSMYEDPDFQQGVNALYWANLGENEGAMA